MCFKVTNVQINALLRSKKSNKLSGNTEALLEHRPTMAFFPH